MCLYPDAVIGTCAIHTFFYKNTINFSEPQIFLNSKPLFDDFPAIPTLNYMLKMLLLICPFRLRTLFPQKTNISHFFEKSSIVLLRLSGLLGTRISEMGPDN